MTFFKSDLQLKPTQSTKKVSKSHRNKTSKSKSPGLYFTNNGVLSHTAIVEVFVLESEKVPDESAEDFERGQDGGQQVAVNVQCFRQRQ